MRRKIMAWLMTFVMVFTSMPIDVFAASVVPADQDIYTIADLDTLTRPADVYGQNTLNAGKVTVGKSVSDDPVTIPYGNTSETFTPDEGNFIIVSSQTAQVMGLASESDVPLDVVFVLDTSGSMNQNGVNRASSMVTAANSAIATLMAANENNRIAVVTFSSADSEDEEYGGGTSNGAAANVLSSLAHYSGDAATNHLTWVNSDGSTTGNGTKDFIAGRDVTTVRRWQNGRWQNVTVNAYRNGSNGGTNIQAGIIEGAKLLTAENNTTTVTDEQGNVITRMPFLVILSDGEPTFSLSDSTWYNPTSDGEQGPGNGSYAGNGFLPVLTAAYYKSLITEKYYGTKASEDNRCNIYTIGVQLNADLAELTMNPKDHFVAGSNNNYYNSFNSYWNSYNAGNGFTIQVNGNGNNANYTISAASITATKDRISGKSSTGAVMYAGGLQYNDEYFAASSTAEIAEAFQGVVTSIQKKAVSSPTHVDAAYGHDFSGYVTYTDILGEYMEVKDMKGVLANGHFYQGASFARILSDQGTAEETAALKASLIDVLETRMSISQSTAIDLDTFLTAAASSPNQLSYTNASNFDNSIVWWGKSFNVEGEEEDHVQLLAHADNDTVEYITDPNTDIPEGADYVCRSYFFYGTAGGTVENPNHDYLYFVVRVQRSLTAPYQQTVVVSAPASLLSVEEVFVVESEDSNGDPVYAVSVEAAEPARVVYEVGLRSDINAYNIESIMAEDAAYLNETAKFSNQDVYTNYDAASGEYTFYTNDWDRTAAEDGHERAMTTVTFDAASDNAFYTYQEDTLVVDANGNAYTGETVPTARDGNAYYIVREYYDWTGVTANADGTYTAEKKTTMIQITPADSGAFIQKDGKWYIAKGVYAASTLSGGEDVNKLYNYTNTSNVVAHPERTGEHTNSHYTVHLGNNGKLTIKAKDSKSVSDGNGNNIDGQAVTVGQELTYTILVVNNEDSAGTAVVTDTIPAGTELVENSITDGGVYSTATKTIRWEFAIDANTTKEVSFKVKVTEDALLQAVPGINNTANVKIGDNEYDTNITHNPPIGKVVEGAGTSTDSNYDGEVTVGTELTYYIEYANDTAIEQTITIVDNLPTGINYVSDSASHGGVHTVAANGDETLTWTLNGVDPGESGVVSFRVVVDASAVTPVENSATIKIGDHEYTTNVTELDVPLGNLTLKKLVVKADDAYNPDSTKEFTLVLTEVASGIAGVGTLNGTYNILRNGNAGGTIEFVNGVAKVSVQANDTVTVQGLPAGTELEITEEAAAGYTASFATLAVTRSTTNAPAPLADSFHIKIEKNATVGVQVTNTYNPAPAYFQLSGTKTLTTDIEDFPLTTFTFRAQACDKDGVISGGNDAITVTAQASVSGTEDVVNFTFSGRNFSKPEVRYYLISEDAGNQGGMTYSNTQYLLTITISDDGSGQLTADWTLQSREGDSGAFSAIIPNTKTVSFTNNYVPLKTELVLQGSKTLARRVLQDKEFSFVVQENGQTVAVGENDANGNIVFSAIPYDKEGTHIYTISEVQAGGNVGYDQSVYTVTVSVTANNTTGQLEAKVISIQKDGTAITENVGNGYVYAFHNEFEPGNAEVILEAKKELKDPENTGRTIRAGEFAFDVYAVKKESGAWIRTSATAVATGTNDVNGNVIFSNLEYSYEDIPSGQTTAEFYYEIEEVIPVLTAEPNMDYDETSRYVKVTLSYDTVKGILSAVVDYNAETPEVDNAASSFVNTVYSPSIQVVPAGTKVTQNTPAEGTITFGFVVINTVTGNEAGAGTVVGSDTAQNITFSPLTYTEPGVYTYWIVESNAGNTTNGITYDATRYLMKVTISRVNGQLQKDVKYYAAREGAVGSTNVGDYTDVIAVPAFKNTYAAEGYLTLTAKKVLTGRNLKANEFAFSLVREGGGEITGLADASGKISMTLYYTDADIPNGKTEATITYTMSEIVPTVSPVPGVTYDTTTHTIKVTVKDGGDGKVSAYVSEVDGVPVTAGGETGIVFNNTYKVVEDAKATIEATKTLTGRGMREGEFFFDLYRKDGNDNIFVASAQNANGKVTFERYYPAATIWEQLGAMDMVAVDPATGRKVGTIIYVLKERNDGMGGVTYDSTEHTIIVTITDNGDGTMSTSVDYNGAEDGLGTAPVFTNSYSAGEITYTPVGSKELLGANEEKLAVTEGQFTFEVVKLAADKTTEEGVVSLGWSQAGGSIRFDPIRYVDNASGTVTNSVTNYYVIREVNRGESGITYSSQKYYLAVTIKDNADGQLVIESAQYYSDAAFTTQVDKVEFTNHYGSGEVNFNLVLKKNFKTSTGKAYNFVLQGSEFDFEVYEWNPKTTTKGAEVTVGTNGKSDANGVASITFGTIIYTREDVYGGNVSATSTFKEFYYVIEEVEPRNADERGIEIDTTPVYVKVTVSDDGYGNLTTSVAYVDQDGTENGVDTFTNTYNPKGVELTITAGKALLGKNWTDEEFSFILSGGHLTADQTIVVDNTKGGLFSHTLEFGSADMSGATEVSDGVFEKKFEYTLIESEIMPTNENGTYTRDAVEYKIVVTLSDNGSGKLMANAKYYKNGTEVTVMEFVNQYTPKALVTNLSEQIHASKTINGREFKDGETFTFEVYDVTGKVVSNGVSETPEDGEADIIFDSFTFNQAGEYHYRIRETSVNGNGITVDTRLWRLSILVTYDADTGMLKIEDTDLHTYEITGTGAIEGRPAFVNVYEPAPTSVTIIATKKLTGRDLKDREFKFYLMEGELIVAEGYNDVSGDIIFTVNYNEVGTHSYSIVEVIPAEKLGGITYDTRTHAVNVTVVISDNGDGQLEANVGSEVSSGVTISNEYNAQPAKAYIEAHKILTGGKDLEANKYTFELWQNGAIVETAENAADGSVSFELLYSEEGVYTYTMKEKAGNEPGVTYDGASYDVTVTIVDDGAGQLHADVKYNTADGLKPTFINTYDSGEATAVFKATKEFVNHQLQGGEFTFELHQTGSDYDVSKSQWHASTTNEADTDGDGYADIEFTKLFDAPGTYYFVMLEVNGGQNEIVYDGTQYQFMVEVGTTVDVTCMNSNVAIPKFTNTPFEEVTEKTVFKNGELNVNIDGQKVEVGDKLTYEITYKNYTGVTREVVTITDTIPQYTTFVTGSESRGGVYANGELTWTFNDVAPGETITVSFAVTVEMGEKILTNEAEVVDGQNTYKTNEVVNHTIEDKLVKDVFNKTEPTISIDGKKVNVGDTLIYTVTYINTTADEATVKINDIIPEHTTYVANSADNGGTYNNGTVIWENLKVAPWASITVSFQVTVDDPEVIFTNVATAIDASGRITSNEVVNHTVVEIVDKDVALETEPTISIDGKKVEAGDVLTYTIEYVNVTGKTVDVKITDIIPEHTTYVAGSANYGGTLADGELTWNLVVGPWLTAEVTFQVTVNDEDAFIKNQAEVYDGKNNYDTDEVVNHTFDEEGEKDVFDAKKPNVSIDGKIVEIGTELLYTISYANTSDAAVDVEIIDTIPAHTTFVSADNSGVHAEGKVTWNLTVAANEEVTVSFKVKVADAGVVIKNQAEIWVGNNGYVTNAVENTVPGKTVDQEVAAAGDTLTYTITYTNVTGAKADVEIIDTLDKNLTYVEESSKATYKDGVLSWSFEDVEDGETVTVSFKAKVNIDAEADEIKNTAIIVENDVEVKTNEIVTELEAPELNVYKVQQYGERPFTQDKLYVKKGYIITYGIVVKNEGDVNAHNITVTDAIPKGLTVVKNAVSNDGTIKNGVVTWNIDTLAPGESVVLTFAVTVPDAEESTRWKNIATVVFENNEDGPEEEIETNEVVIEVDKTPQTGDEQDTGMFAGMAAMALIGMGAAIVASKKRKEEAAE